MTPALPVDSFLDDIRDALERRRAAVLVAAPGAGKTTRVPPALVDDGRVLLLQPRRVAARAMARRIAIERGWTIGREAGWHIRFDRQFSSDTRLLVVTEGILTAYLQQDPLLSDVRTVVFDEFHERSVHADLGIAMAKQAWLARSDLRILVMSATLDSSQVSRFLDDAPVVEVPGMLHPLTTEYAPAASAEQALRTAIQKGRGHVLYFLPGVREIQQAMTACRDTAGDLDIDMVPLHGSLDAAAQDAALSADSRRRRVIMSTNIAETSLTVPGVSTVIDAGLHKVARYDADRAVDALATERITLDSADQRAGRAARIGPGFALRLWDHRDRLRPHRDAEIHRVDLAGPLLAILAWGASPADFEWFDAPAADRIEAGIALLTRLGALDNGQITTVGRQMQELPLTPRLARVLIGGAGSFEVCASCTYLSEPAVIDTGSASAASDMLPLLDRWPSWPPHLRHTTTALLESAKRVLGGHHPPKSSESDLLRALLSGYPDRVAKRRSGDRFTLASGHGAVIARDSHVRAAEWIVALDVTAGRTTATTEALVRLASSIDPSWLTPTSSELRHTLDGDSGTVKAVEIDWFDAIALCEHPVTPDPSERTRLLAAAWRDAAQDPSSTRLLRRLAFAGTSIDVDELVQAQAASAKRVSDISLTEESLPWDTRDRLTKLAPDKLVVPSGRAITIDYEDDGGVSVSVKLQELFGLAQTPRMGPARTPITFHLLAPSGRPVQTTRDLESFWERTYPEVRKELRGRYPRHPWPDDPWTAAPTHRTKRR